MSKKSGILILLIGQTFLWTGSAFMSVLYRLYASYTPTEALLLTEVFYYLLQAFGIAVFALLLAKKPAAACHRLSAPLSVMMTGAFTALALLTASSFTAAVAGALMNVFIGILSGIYLTRLASQVPQDERGRVFGYSYAIGSIGTYLLSLPQNGVFLQSSSALYVFTFLVILSVFFTRYLEPIMDDTSASLSPQMTFDKKLLLLAFLVPLACSATNGLGAFFVTADLSGMLNPSMTRAFYAVGLIAAGHITDRSRRWGAACCIAALVFPFISLALRDEPAASAILSIFSYIFYGFFSVYRVVLFADIAGKYSSLRFLAVFGLLSGRIGDAVGTFGGILLGSRQIVLTCLTAAVFIACILLFFDLYHRLYLPHLSEKDHLEMLLSAYEERFGFTSRQREIFRLVIRGCSNAEISAELFLAESTVKFHIKNILSKTGCTNRSELIADFKKS